jgi:hypothetical protein
MSLPSNVDIAAARLPAAYEHAKAALASCEKVDETKEWASKAEALAAYAKMADDDSLRQMADRIQARAVRRMGELLKQFDGSTRNKDATAPIGNEGALITQKQVADAAGVSDHQRVQAVRVANVPEEKFEAAIEAEKPATITTLAEMGRQIRSVPEDSFRRATHLIGAVKRFAEFCKSNRPETVAAGVMAHEDAELCEMVEAIEGWLDRFVGLPPRNAGVWLVFFVRNIMAAQSTLPSADWNDLKAGIKAYLDEVGTVERAVAKTAPVPAAEPGPLVWKEDLAKHI